MCVCTPLGRVPRRSALGDWGKGKQLDAKGERCPASLLLLAASPSVNGRRSPDRRHAQRRGTSQNMYMMEDQTRGTPRTVRKRRPHYACPPACVLGRASGAPGAFRPITQPVKEPRRTMIPTGPSVRSQAPLPHARTALMPAVAGGPPMDRRRESNLGRPLPPFAQVCWTCARHTSAPAAPSSQPVRAPHGR